ncbi:metal-dependent hydrolase [Paenibacillus sp. JX-17]|uniref:Metal-dependent hydrolase n=1 Tax=Paenibacillus lacisoli TaxID=3064525 RepID=A0ABT9C8F3_9BACL|nr:metal-dependent hydrolase [Paenibacillus sp. JX-17]MDO7905520.1 metal-dependent hydrolase [Paenibacillus sp. JX-17]
MMGRAHLVIGTGVSLSLLHLQGVPVTVGAAATALVGSLLPDIDEPNSLLMTRTMPNGMLRVLQLAMVILAVWLCVDGAVQSPWNIVLSLAIAAVSFLPFRALRKVLMLIIGVGLAVYGGDYTPWNLVAGCLLVVCTVLPHRGLTHTVYGLAVWTALLYGTTSNSGDSIWLAGGIAYLLHLLADSLTNRGIKPLPPFKWRLRFNLMSTGTRHGAIVENVCILLTLLLTGFVFLPGWGWGN